MAKKTTRQDPAPAKKAPGIPVSLNTPEFSAAWLEWCQFTTERGIERSKEDAARQLQLLAKLGPDNAIADIRMTMATHPLKDRVPEKGKASPEKKVKAEKNANPEKKAKALKE